MMAIDMLAELYAKVNSLLSLERDWDSYGAERISADSALNALWLLLQVMDTKTPMPSIVPVANGDVQIEWHTGGVDLEVDVHDDSYGIDDVEYELLDIDDLLEKVEGLK